MKITYANRTIWKVNGKLHRKKGPAVILIDGTKFYYQYGKRHRINGPAIEYSDGAKSYFIHGKRHRVDGPAKIYSDGDMFYYLDGVELSKKEFDMCNFIDNLI